MQKLQSGKVSKKTRKARKVKAAKSAAGAASPAEAAAQAKRSLRYQKAIARHEARAQELMRKVGASELRIMLGAPSGAVPSGEC